MISNSLISRKPCIIRHVLSNSISEIEAQRGVDTAIKLITDSVHEEQKCAILINVSNYSFETLEARRIWALQFKMNISIQKMTDFVAIVGASIEPFYTEKIWLGTTRLKYFEFEQEAEVWLKHLKGA